MGFIMFWFVLPLCVRNYLHCTMCVCNQKRDVNPAIFTAFNLQGENHSSHLTCILEGFDNDLGFQYQGEAILLSDLVQ